MRETGQAQGRPGIARRGARRLHARRRIAPLAFAIFVSASAASLVASAQVGGKGVREGADESPVARAASAVCAERALDPRGSVPIDEMQERPSLPARNAEVVAGAARAARLLPVAKALTEETLERLMSENGVGFAARRAAVERVEEVERVRLEVPLRDNASVVYGDPHSIRFGTIFVASLKSDEGMVSVMAHELTHAADGARGTLAPLFRRVARRAEQEAGLRQVSARRAEELTCDFVGVLAARLYIARNETEEPLARRAARAVEHNCVEQDETDAAHLSPRQTLRALLSLDQTLAGEVTGEIETETAATLNHIEPRTAYAAPRSARIAQSRAARAPAHRHAP
ncbi:MAG: hypothetical protein LC746_05480 [Acidobacteria bacterium]|nr:hypothetical protein [Acidobacteriota bacterium]